ncbi:MAG: fluoride efflux transporter CrcB [Dehalococcoidia bacterium]
MKILIIGLGGFLGTTARYGLSGLVQDLAGASFPAGTLAVNILGCIAIGGIMSLVEDRQMLTPEARLLLLVGFLGSFTTFSTFGYETFDLLREGQLWMAVVNAAANLLIGILGVGLGWAGVRALGA